MQRSKENGGTDHKTGNRPLQVSGRSPVHGAVSDFPGERGIRCIELLLNLAKDPLFVLRKWHVITSILRLRPLLGTAHLRMESFRQQRRVANPVTNF